MRCRHVVMSVCAVASAWPAVASSPGDISWGKPGVSLDQYATDATQCTDASSNVPVSIKPGTLRQMDALSSARLLDITTQLAHDPNANPMAMVTDMTFTKSQDDIARRSNTFGGQYVAIAKADVTDELQAALDACLTERGYVRIRLDAAQTKALSRLKRHGAERTAYLHALDSDAAIVARQRLDVGGP